MDQCIREGYEHTSVSLIRPTYPIWWVVRLLCWSGNAWNSVRQDFVESATKAAVWNQSQDPSILKLLHQGPTVRYTLTKMTQPMKRKRWNVAVVGRVVKMEFWRVDLFYHVPWLQFRRLHEHCKTNAPECYYDFHFMTLVYLRTEAVTPRLEI